MNTNDIPDLTKFRVYPLPANDLINIEINDGAPVHSMQLRDINGKMIIDNNITTSKTMLDIGELPGGIYLMKITSGNDTRVCKIIKL
ncbi:MAG: T9SS type A sorting domain-containing protein [Bacteroidota bacterium]